MTLSTRIIKAIKTIHDGKIKLLENGSYQVEGTGGSRIVTLNPPYFTCTCPWGDRKWLANSCYHAIAACGMAGVDLPLEVIPLDGKTPGDQTTHDEMGQMTSPLRLDI